ncbi:DNA helicase [Babesia caballi]|uniref:DNA helicase n=1 Tax=Babesia caballi TaxID=5871 RepID=A0AAV4LZP0_BABCB|nr:DNA helicase [Babesia caballi]
MKLVREEGLERGSFALTAAFGVVVTALAAGPGTSMSTPRMAKMGGHIGQRVPLRLYIFPKPTMSPDATIIKISGTLLRQEGQLKLQSIGVLRKLAHKRGTGRVREAHAVAEKVMKIWLINTCGCTWPLKSAQNHRRIKARHSEVTLQVGGTEGVGSYGRFTGVGDRK